MDLSGVSGFHEIIVLTPRGFEEGLDAVMAVREQRTVLLNLSEMESKLAQRTADFVSGGVYALQGQERRVGERVLLFAPASVDIDQLS